MFRKISGGNCYLQSVIYTVDSCYLEHALFRISRYLELFAGLFSIYSLLPHKMFRKLSLRYLELFAVWN